jgi:hypothetical protein
MRRPRKCRGPITAIVLFGYSLISACTPICTRMGSVSHKITARPPRGIRQRQQPATLARNFIWAICMTSVTAFLTIQRKNERDQASTGQRHNPEIDVRLW